MTKKHRHKTYHSKNMTRHEFHEVWSKLMDLGIDNNFIRGATTVFLTEDETHVLARVITYGKPENEYEDLKYFFPSLIARCDEIQKRVEQLDRERCEATKQ